jgi:hypothetical protein
MVADGMTVDQIVAELVPLKSDDVWSTLRDAAEREIPLRTTV